MKKSFKKFIGVFLCLCILSSTFAFATTPLATSSAQLSTNVITNSIPSGAKIPDEEQGENLFTNPFANYVKPVVGEMGLSIPAKSSILMDASTGNILYENNSHEKLAPASITKIMSLVLIMEAVDNGSLKMTDKVTTSAHAASMGGSQIWLEPNEVMTVSDMIKGVCVASANDCTVALAEKISGTEGAFVSKMNTRAKELGCKDTHFVNCTGLDSPDHYTSAFDVAIMSKALITHNTIKKFSSIWMDSLRDGKIGLVNTNKLVHFYPGCFGLKTGTTSQAGSCLSAAAEKDGMTLISVVLGASSSAQRFDGARSMLDYGFSSFSALQLKAKNSDFKNVKVTGGTETSVPVKVKNSISAVIPKGKDSEVKKTVQLSTNLTAPVKQGAVIGKIKYTLDGENLGEITLVAGKSVNKMSFSVALNWLFSGLFAN